MQVADAALKAHDRGASTALTHSAGSLQHRSYRFKRQNDTAHEFVDASARGAVDPNSHLGQ